MNAKQVMLIASVSLISVASSSAQADPISLNFDTLQNHELVDNYYNGGFGSLGSGPGPNYGITFANAFVLNELDLVNNDVAQLITPPNAITFLTGSGALMDVSGGFTTGFSFNYSAPFFAGVVEVWSGPDGTGALLASLTLPLTPDGAGNPACGGKNYCPDVPFGVSFNGTAHSVNFSGNANFIVYDDITLGSSTPITTPLPAALPLFAGGLGLMGLLGWGRKRKAALH